MKLLTPKENTCSTRLASNDSQLAFVYEIYGVSRKKDSEGFPTSREACYQDRLSTVTPPTSNHAQRHFGLLDKSATKLARRQTHDNFHYFLGFSTGG